MNDMKLHVDIAKLLGCTCNQMMLQQPETIMKWYQLVLNETQIQVEISVGCDGTDGCCQMMIVK